MVGSQELHTLTYSAKGHWKKLLDQESEKEIDEVLLGGSMSTEDPDSFLSLPRTNPYELLSAALKVSGHDIAVPRYFPNKLDLSYFDPLNIPLLTKEEREVELERIRRIKANIGTTARPTASSIIAHHLLAASATGLSPIPNRPKFTRKQEEWLQYNGFAYEDVARWTEILTSPTPRLDGLPNRLPTSVIVFLLRRERINASTLRALFGSICEHLAPGPDQDLKISDESGCTESESVSDFAQESSVHSFVQLFLIFVRMLHHARIVWPEAIPEITKIIPTYIHYHNKGEKQRWGPTNILPRVSLMYNSALSLLSKPASLRPVISSVYQERAQFSLLQAMAKHEPPLFVTRKGYTGIIAVQLARRKTIQERDWVSLQARSWPPWKKNRTGLDEEKGVEYGTSQAAMVIDRMEQSGYPERDMDKVANIFAGWDLDESPTVPTRTLLPRWSRSVSDNFWVARINTTRTVREAWACFLSWKESSKPSEGVYCAMISKLLLNERQNLRTHERSVVDAEASLRPLGERVEPFDEPTSPLDETYVRIAPPSAVALFDEMIAEGINPSSTMLGRLLLLVNTGSDAVYFVSKSGTEFQNLWNSLSGNMGESDSPKRFLALLNAGLCQVADDELLNDDFLIETMRVLLVERPRWRPCWNFLFEALARRERTVWLRSRSEQRSNTDLVRLLLHTMEIIDLELDSHGFAHVCKCFENHALERLRTGRGSRSQREYISENTFAPPMDSASQHQTPIDKTGFEDSKFLRRLFQKVVFGNRDNDLAERTEKKGIIQPPPLNATPNASELHKYVRALGVLGDHEGIWSLVQWISLHKEEVAVLQAETFRGYSKMRILLTSIRVFLECPRYDIRALRLGVGSGLRPANEELVALAEEMINGFEDWGGWPTWDEVKQYLDRNKGTYQMT